MSGKRWVSCVRWWVNKSFKLKNLGKNSVESNVNLGRNSVILNQVVIGGTRSRKDACLHNVKLYSTSSPLEQDYIHHPQQWVQSLTTFHEETVLKLFSSVLFLCHVFLNKNKSVEYIGCIVLKSHSTFHARGCMQQVSTILFLLSFSSFRHYLEREDNLDNCRFVEP